MLDTQINHPELDENGNVLLTSYIEFLQNIVEIQGENVIALMEKRGGDQLLFERPRFPYIMDVVMGGNSYKAAILDQNQQVDDQNQQVDDQNQQVDDMDQ